MTTAFEELKQELLSFVDRAKIATGNADMIREHYAPVLMTALHEAEQDQLSVARLHLDEGDILVMSDPGKVRVQEAERFKDWIRERLTEAGLGEVPIMVLDGGRSLQVLKASPSLVRSREPLTFTREEEEAGDLFGKAATELQGEHEAAAERWGPGDRAQALALDHSLGSAGGEGLYEAALDRVVRTGKPSASFLQRTFAIGYNAAAALIERMEAEGFISAANRAGKREITAKPRTEEES